MTVTLTLKPEMEADLLAQAKASGMTVEAYILSIVESSLDAATQRSLSPDQRADAFETWAKNHRPTPPLSDYAVSREAMYEDRDR